MMHVGRRLGVMAWLLATALSVGVSTAAVEAVRAQVTDRPDVVSLATLRRATSTTTTPVDAVPQRLPIAAPPPMSTTTTTPPSTTGSTRPPATATPATEVELATQPSNPPTTSAETGAGVETRELEGGTVTISFDGETLTLVEAVPAEGYEVKIFEERPRRVALRFSSGRGKSVGYLAQVVNGHLRIRVFD